MNDQPRPVRPVLFDISEEEAQFLEACLQLYRASGPRAGELGRLFGPKPQPDAPKLDELMKLSEVAKELRVSENQARRLFEDEPGVLNVADGKYKVLRIPKGVFLRVAEGRTNGDPLDDLKRRRRRRG